jgi:streptomycin 6-kinase
VARGALLLEHLDAARSLASVPVAEAAGAAGALARRLAIEAPGSFPSLRATARRLATTFHVRQRSLHDPVPDKWIALAAGLAADLARDLERLLVHTDLHHDNILASDRPGERWVAIDPTAAIGAPERSAAELLWTRADELSGPQAVVSLLDTFVEGGRLNRAKAIAWGFVRSIDYWLWGLDNGLMIDPLRCERVASALARWPGARDSCGGAGYPGRAGGPWLRRTCPRGDFASVVPSGCRVSVQPHWWMQIKW